MELYLQGCATRLPVADSSVQLAVTSPPYAQLRANTYGGIPADGYVDWFMPIAEELSRVLRDGGSFVLNIKESSAGIGAGKQRYVYELILALMDSGWLLHDEYIWRKRSPYPGRWNTRFTDAWERLFHLSKTSDIVFNRKAVMLPRKDLKATAREVIKNQKARAKWGAQQTNLNRYSKRIDYGQLHPTLRYPTNIITANSNGSSEHSAVMPAALPQFFIALCSNEGDTILDPFMGSGTTVRQAALMARRGIGIDILPAAARTAYGSRLGYGQALL